MDQKEVIVLGGGESGVGAAILAQKVGLPVFLSDAGILSDHYKTILDQNSIAFEEGGHTWERILEAKEIIKSPGIPRNSEFIQKAISRSIPVIGELEFASRYTSAKLIAITGSNGKTTTSLLTYHILKNAGLKVGLGGNIGRSFAGLVAEDMDSKSPYDYYVLEISSFQLEDQFAFKAHIAILLNITPDHLDRYEYSLEKYAATKFRIIQNLVAEDAFIYCADDPVTMREIERHTLFAQKHPFTLSERSKEAVKLDNHTYISNNQIIINTHHKSFTMSIFDLSLEGKHNIYNTMAAGICAKLLDISNLSIRESMGNFKNIPHRLESVAKVQGIEFINDSKATNVNSVWYALETMHNPVIWIAGGVDKGNDYSMLLKLVRQKVKAIVCLGKDTQKLYSAFENEVEIMVNAFSAKEAVTIAYHLGKKGDTVLLSPACASFDLFNNYEDRGNQFKEAVMEL
jgi:UDP-N-acetylmuramoylalanine--D-glutamate ligase